MRLINLNVNGLRSAFRKGLADWLLMQNADFICVQETKVQLNQPQHTFLSLPDYHLYAADAIKAGYSGVAIFSRQKPLKISNKLGWPCADNEGRFIQLDYPQFIIISLYLPSGSSSIARQNEKIIFLERLKPILENLLRLDKPVIIAGDWNIAHRTIDLKNWRANQKNPGFLPEERAWLDEILAMGWQDSLRYLHPDQAIYTWWSNRANAWANNVGWRIDYQLTSDHWLPLNAQVYREQRFSDHAPVVMEYKLT